MCYGSTPKVKAILQNFHFPEGYKLVKTENLMEKKQERQGVKLKRRHVEKEEDNSSDILRIILRSPFKHDDQIANFERVHHRRKVLAPDIAHYYHPNSNWSER